MKEGKDMKKVLLCVLLCMCILFAGCTVHDAQETETSDEAASSAPTKELKPAETSVETKEISNTEDAPEDPVMERFHKVYWFLEYQSPLPETLDLPITMEMRALTEDERDSGMMGEHGTLDKGKLVFSITDMYLIDSATKLQNPNGVVVDDMCMEKGTTSVTYRELVKEDGSYGGGMVMLMMDVTVTSEGAYNWTSDQIVVGEDGFSRPAGENPDPFCFDLGDVFLPQIVDVHRGYLGYIPEIIEDDVLGVNRDRCSMCYFSEAYKAPSGREWDFYLKPGETMTFSVGFPVIPEESGGTINLDTLYLEMYDLFLNDRQLGFEEIQVGDKTITDHAFVTHIPELRLK